MQDMQDNSLSFIQFQSISRSPVFVGRPVPPSWDRGYHSPLNPHILCGILQISFLFDHSFVDRLYLEPKKETGTMHDLLIALAFIGMVIAPAIVAANTSTEASEESE